MLMIQEKLVKIFLMLFVTIDKHVSNVKAKRKLKPCFEDYNIRMRKK